MKNKTTINGDLNKPNFVKYPKIPYLEENKEILGKTGYFFEKIDGALCQVRNTNLGLLGGSKANYITGKNANVAWFPKFLKWMHSNGSLYNLRKDVIMFGEWLTPTTIDYDKRNLNKFYFIDLAYVGGDSEKPKFFDYDEARGYLEKWGIRNIEVLDSLEKGNFNKDKIEELKKRESFLRQGNQEGLVLKDYKTQKFRKSLNEEYSEIREQEKTLEERYINLPRIKKAKRRLREKGKRNIRLNDLVSEVSIDIHKESKIRFNSKAIRGIIRIKGLVPKKRTK